ncbi:hypothetical protein QL285_058089 [Trifolium repens]|nr:hypothetical protein QL285_058089 [Trifolium repens]
MDSLLICFVTSGTSHALLPITKVAEKVINDRLVVDSSSADKGLVKEEELQKERQTSSDNEAFVTVFGKEHHGYVRGMGLGPTPSQINGSSCRPSGSTSSSTADAKIAKMQSEIDVLTKEVAEVNELKAKVAEFDAMKEQFDLIMANMQNHVACVNANFGLSAKSNQSSSSQEHTKDSEGMPEAEAGGPEIISVSSTSKISASLGVQEYRCKISEEEAQKTRIQEEMKASTQEMIDAKGREGIAAFSAAEVVAEEIKALESSNLVVERELATLRKIYAECTKDL